MFSRNKRETDDNCILKRPEIFENIGDDILKKSEYPKKQNTELFVPPNPTTYHAPNNTISFYEVPPPPAFNTPSKFYQAPVKPPNSHHNVPINTPSSFYEVPVNTPSSFYEVPPDFENNDLISKTL